MPGSPRSASASDRSWRAQPRIGRAATTAKQVNRVLLTLFGLFLAGLLAWLLWWWIFLPAVRLVCLPVVNYDCGRVPAIPFSREDVDALGNCSHRALAAKLEDLQTSESIPTLSTRLQGEVRSPRDVLILYVRVHGVSDDGAAWLLCSDFLRRDGYRGLGAGRYELDELLGQVDQCRATRKLLLLDAGHIGADPRLGMVVNEFPRLLAEKLGQINDPGLWVLSASGPLEISHASCSEKRTVFNYFVTEGLRGAADQDGNGMVGLAELGDFVRSRVADWVHQQSNGQETQTPTLLQCGGGVANPPTGPDLLRVSDRRQSKAGEEENGSQTDSTRESDERKKQTPDPQVLAVKKVRQLLNDSWQLRDRMEDRGASASWSPVDYAPHLWRQYQERLLGYEQHDRGGAAFRTAELARKLEANLRPLQETVAEGGLPAGAAGATVPVLLADARRRFLQNDPKPGEATEAIQLKNDLVYRARDYVRWHARVLRTSDRPHRLHPTLSELLRQLREFVAELDSLEEASLAGASAAEMKEKLEEVNRRKARLEELRRSMEEDGLEKDAADLAEKALKDPGSKGIAGAMDALLATPLLSAGVRMRLLEAREQLDQALPDPAIAVAGPMPQPPSIVRWQQRLRNQAELEVALVLLADPAARLVAPGEPADTDESQVSESLWEQYRQFGKRLGTFYQGLPAKIKGHVASADPANIRSAERLLRLVDARDARRVTADVASIAVREIRFPVVAERRLAVDGPEGLSLLPDGPTPFEITMEVIGPSSGGAQIAMQYDRREVTVRTAAGGPPLQPGQWQPISPAQAPMILSYQVEAKAKTGAESPLSVTARCGEMTDTHQIVLRLPAPDVVDLVVDGTPGTTAERTDGTAGVRLRPFPNRVTPYRFSLVNRSGRERKVTVQLLSVPQSPPGRRPSGELLLDELGNLRPGVEELAPPLAMGLPADPTPVPVPFPAPKPPAEEAAPGAASEEESPPEGAPVTHGLACVIRDADSGEPKWIRWIDFVPRPPRDYLRPEVGYDAGQGRISIKVRAADPQQLPPLSPQSPINVVWNTQGEFGADTTVKDKAALTATDGVAELFAEVEPDADRKVQVRLTADGYPRAFVYEVKCDRDREDVPRERSRSEVEILQPEENHVYQIPLKEPMIVAFWVDAPEDAFQRPGDVVEVGIDEDGDRELRGEECQRFFGDRQVGVRLEGLGPRGDVKIKTAVSDFRVPLQPKLKNAEVDVMVRLLLEGEQAARDTVGVVLDGSEPEFSVVAPGWPVPQGDPVKVTAKVEKDVSGVETMQFGFCVEKAGQLEPAGKPKVLRQAGADDEWSTLLPTEKLPPGPYVLVVRATDRAGNSGTQRQLVTIEPRGEENGGKKTSTIDGRVLLAIDGRPLSGIKVSLRGTKYGTETDGSGRFTFKDVPHGEYTLDAKGIVIGREKAVEREIVLPFPSEPAVVEIRLEW